MKAKARALLETDLVGRPFRKIFWLLHVVAQKFHHITGILLEKHPYIQKLNRNGHPFQSSDDGLVRYYANLKGTIASAPYQPLISVILPVYKVKAVYLEECLESLAAQTYENWEACIVDDYSQDPKIEKIILKFKEKYKPKVKFHKNDKNLHISLSSNKALAMASGDYVAFFDHDDRILPNALGEVVRFINLHDKPDILYSDESTIDEKGNVLRTYFKPDWSPLMHLSVNYTTHFSVYRRTLIEEIGGCRAGFEGAQDHDLMMRATEKSKTKIIHIPIVIYQWRSHELSTASNSTAKPYASIAGCKAIEEACLRRGTPATVEFEPQYHHYKVRFQIQEPLPLVSILILSRDGFNLIKPCLDSIFEKSTYPNFEVILIDHESKDPDCLSLFEEYKSKYPERFHIIRYQGPFNFAKKNNIAANAANGTYLILLNNDIEVISPDWIEELLAIAQQRNIGAVGPKLVYPNGKIQHAGLVGRGSWIAGHNALGIAADTFDYFAYHQTTHEALGVTGACLMIAKDKYQNIGGLEEFFVPNGFGDVDICLRLKKQGLTNVYVPYARLIHKESYTRKASFELFEKYYMMEKWSYDLLRDPYRHIAFELSNYFTIESGYRIQEPSNRKFAEILDAAEFL